MTIDRVRVLHGHVSPETAYLVDDYPYGRTLRCKIRYWIETAEKGTARGNQRFVYQTTNPKVVGEVWNKPKAGTYSQIKIMFLDEINHVDHNSVEVWVTPERDARLRLRGIYEQMEDGTRRMYDALVKHSRTYAPPWEAWEEKVAAVALHIRETGHDPELTEGVWVTPTKRTYLGSDVEALFATAHNRVNPSS